MKAKLITSVCVAAVLAGTATPSFASSDSDPAYMIADTMLVRPGCLVATAVGSVFFVVSLPIALISKSVKKTANTLVVKPAKATFTRPVGDMEALLD
jgi:hypothetical protein